MTADLHKNEYPLNQIYFYLTEGCNLRCRHCWLAPKHQTVENPGTTLSVDFFKSIIEQGKALGLTAVKLTGGEPFLHPQIEQILDHVKVEGLELVVETNAVLATEKMARKVAECQDSFVSISIDGAEPQTHDYVRNTPGSFTAALEGIAHFVDSGVRPQIIMSIMQCNKDQIEDVVRLAEKIGAESIKFNIIQPTLRGATLHGAQETIAIEELVSIGAWVENTLSGSTSLRVYYDHPDSFRPLSKIYGEKGDGCASCGIKGVLGVLANGSYALCGIGEAVPELVFGHAENDALKDVWEKTPALQEIRENLPAQMEGICQDCLIKDNCLGSCIAQNYYRRKSLWAPYWYCEEADKHNLFPENRRISTYMQERQN